MTSSPFFTMKFSITVDTFFVTMLPRIMMMMAATIWKLYVTR